MVSGEVGWKFLWWGFSVADQDLIWGLKTTGYWFFLIAVFSFVFFLFAGFVGPKMFTDKLHKLTD